MLSFLVPVVLAPAFLLACWQWGLGVAAIHTLYVLALSLCLSALLLAGYRKIPLTCPMPGFRDNLLALCVIQVVGFSLFTQLGAHLELRMLSHPWNFLLVPLAMAGAWFWKPPHRRSPRGRRVGRIANVRKHTSPSGGAARSFRRWLKPEWARRHALPGLAENHQRGAFRTRVLGARYFIFNNLPMKSKWRNRCMSVVRRIL
jgi:hypothetical protein